MNIHIVSRQVRAAYAAGLLYTAGLLGCVSATAYGQNISQTGAIGDSPANANGKEGVTVWAVPAEQKVRPEDKTEDANLVWSAVESKISVAGAGNEHVPFQVVVSTSVSGSPRKMEVPSGFFIEASDLTSAGGQTIPKSQIGFFLQHYIFLDAPSSVVGETGYWPDALVPLREPFSMAAQYSIVPNRPVWVDLTVPAGTPGGTYTGTITVSQNGRPLDTLVLEAEVYGFSLPEETPLITYINVSRNWLAGYYHQPSDSEEISQLTQTYYDFLYENRMEPWFNDMLLPRITVNGGQVKVAFDDERYEYYMNVLKTKRVLLNALPGALERVITAEPFSAAFNEAVGSYLSQVTSYFERHGWKDRLVFNSPIDEPRSKEEYEDTRRWAGLVKEAAPGVPFLVTRTPVPVKGAADWGTLQGYANNFSVHGNHMNDPELNRVIREEKAKGGEITWYISCDQGYPQPNYFIDAPAMDPVMVPWITARYGMDGILYWAVNFWSQTSDPWLDAGTFHSGFLCSGGWVLNGEGSLFYPGDEVKRYTGQPDVDGPVASMRFQLLREGIEDYVYLKMLETSGEGEFAEELVGSLVVDVASFSRNVEKLYLARRAMAKRLEELNQ